MFVNRKICAACLNKARIENVYIYTLTLIGTFAPYNIDNIIRNLCYKCADKICIHSQ